MGPKFDPYLNFQADGSLDVCGPTNFGAQDVMFRLIRVRVKDHANTQVEQTFNPPPRSIPPPASPAPSPKPAAVESDVAAPPTQRPAR